MQLVRHVLSEVGGEGGQDCRGNGGRSETPAGRFAMRLKHVTNDLPAADEQVPATAPCGKGS